LNLSTFEICNLDKCEIKKILSVCERSVLGDFVSDHCSIRNVTVYPSADQTKE